MRHVSRIRGRKAGSFGIVALLIVTMAFPLASAYTPASLNQRMATRSGPGTMYTEELGTLPQSTAITLIEMVTTNGTPWGMVEFYKNNMKYRAYTGMKRINAYGPVNQGSTYAAEHLLNLTSNAYYGPGYDYARRNNAVFAGTQLYVYDAENGFYLCDYQEGDKWVRAWIPDALSGYLPPPPPAPPPASSAASLNQRMATRSGPGTKYTEELGTLPQSTAIKLIEYVTTNGTPWGMVEFTKNKQLYRAYTGMKRINAYGPVAYGNEHGTPHVLLLTTDVYYGPGYHYAKRKEAVFAGTQLYIYDVENGFYLCDYQQGGKWVRAYFPEI